MKTNPLNATSAALTPEENARQFWLGIRRGLLALVDVIETHQLNTSPTTGELRQAYHRVMKTRKDGVASCGDVSLEE